jgi:TolA-binding protein
MSIQSIDTTTQITSPKASFKGVPKESTTNERLNDMEARMDSFEKRIEDLEKPKIPQWQEEQQKIWADYLKDPRCAKRKP